MWILDNEANNHIIGDLSLQHDYKQENESQVHTADRSMVSSLGSDSANISGSITLSHVLYVPKYSSNLISVSSLIKLLNCYVFWRKEGDPVKHEVSDDYW